MLGSLLMLTCASASAQVVMGGLKPWYITYGATTGADVADLEGAVKRGGNMRMQSAHYFPQTVSFKVGEGASAKTVTADYVLQVRDYKCGTVGSVKIRTEDYFMYGTSSPSYSTGIQYEAPYKIERPNSAAGREWTAVCKGTRPTDMIPVSALVPNVPYNITHEMVIVPIRQQIKANQNKVNSSSPAPAASTR